MKKSFFYQKSGKSDVLQEKHIIFKLINKKENKKINNYKSFNKNINFTPTQIKIYENITNKKNSVEHLKNLMIFLKNNSVIQKIYKKQYLINEQFINFFTEKYIFIKKINNKILYEPLPFSFMEIEIFGLNKEYNLNEINFITDLLKIYSDNNYILDINPFFQNNLEIFKILHKNHYKIFNFIQNKNNIFNGGENKLIKKNKLSTPLTIEEKEKLENIRQFLNSAHNFSKNNNSINCSIKYDSTKKIIKNIQKLSLNALEQTTKINKEKYLKSNLCEKNFPPQKTFITDFNKENEMKYVKLIFTPIFNSQSSPKKSSPKKNSPKKKSFNKNSTKCPKNSTSKKMFSFNQCNNESDNCEININGNIEGKLLKEILINDYSGLNVFYFAFRKKNNENSKHLLYFKELMYNVFGRYNFLINDANGIQNVIGILSNNSKEEKVKKNLLKNYKNINTIPSFGMIIDPAKSKNNIRQQKLFKEDLYKKLFLEIFADLQLHGLKFDFKFKDENIKFQNKDKINYFYIFFIDNSKTDESKSSKIKIIIKQNNHNFNDKTIIKNIISNIVNIIYEKSKNNCEKNDKMLCTPIKKNIEFLEKLFNEDSIEKMYYKIIKILFEKGYNFYEVIRFILRFKILGDKIQALEAKYNCSLINFFGCNYEDINVHHRILATQDRPLCSYSMLEGDINFISKATLKGYKIVFWNFGDAKDKFEQEKLKNFTKNNLNKKSTNTKILNYSETFKNNSISSNLTNVSSIKNNSISSNLTNISSLSNNSKNNNLINVNSSKNSSLINNSKNNNFTYINSSKNSFFSNNSESTNLTSLNSTKNNSISNNSINSNFYKKKIINDN